MGRTIHRDDEDLISVVPDKARRKRLLSTLESKGFLKELENDYYEIQDEGEDLIHVVREILFEAMTDVENTTVSDVADALSPDALEAPDEEAEDLSESEPNTE